MKHRVEVIALCCLLLSMAGYQTVRSQAATADKSEKKSVESRVVRAFVAGHVVLSDAIEPGKVEVYGTNAVHKSESSEGVLFAVVGGGFVPADLKPTGERSMKDEENEGLKKGPDSELPEEYALFQNYPNPFNPVTRIRYDLPAAGRVKLVVFDVIGREIATLADEEQSAGYKSVEFSSTRFASGVYFYRLATGSFVETKKMILMK